MAMFDKLHHICVIVEDIDAAQKYYESIGIGPWIAYPPMTEYAELDVPNPQAFFKLQYRVCNLRNIQWQLCQPDDQPSPQREFLNKKGPGVYHIGFEVTDANAAESEAKLHNLNVISRGRRANGSGFTYYDSLTKAGMTLLTRATPPNSKT